MPRRKDSVVDAANADDGLGVLLGLRLRLAEMMDAADVNANIVPQIAGRLQAVNREIDERRGLLEVDKPTRTDDEPDDELARLRSRASR